MTTRTTDLIQIGDHASRPAATDVPGGGLYSCTDHGKVYRTDGAVWQDWLTLSTVDTEVIRDTIATTLVAGANMTVTPDDGADTVTLAASGGGGGGAADALTPEVLHGTYGDHFPDADLDTAKWNRVTYVDADDTATDSHLVVAARAAGAYYWQAAPAGDWTLVMKGACVNAFGGVTMFGLLAVNNSGNGIGAGPYTSTPATPLVGGVTAGVYSGGFESAVGPLAAHIVAGHMFWLKLVKVGTTYKVAASLNGQVWGPLSPAYTNATAITRVGFGQFLDSGVKQFIVDFFDVQ